MSSYTIELRNVCEIYTRQEVESWFKDYDLTDFLTPSQIQVITESGIWKKEKLAKKIVDHYFMREIGFETPALFAHKAKVLMQEIMEEKLPLIYTNSIEYDPLVNVDYTETFQKTGNENGTNQGRIDNNSHSEGISNSNSSNNGSSLAINNNTPQTNITKQNLESGIYASNVNQNDTSNSIEDETVTSSSANNTQTNSSSSNINNTEQYTRHFKGNQGISASYQAMIKQFRENIVAIDRDIIKELNVLFMGIF